jgi:hypothetical protein
MHTVGSILNLTGWRIGLNALIATALENGKGRILPESRILKTERAQIVDGASIGTNDANMTAGSA